MSQQRRAKVKHSAVLHSVAALGAALLVGCAHHAAMKPSGTRPTTRPVMITTQPTTRLATTTATAWRSRSTIASPMPTTARVAPSPVATPKPAIAQSTAKPSKTTTAKPWAAKAVSPVVVAKAATSKPSTMAMSKAVTQPSTMAMALSTKPATRIASTTPFEVALNPAPPSTQPLDVEGDEALADQWSAMAQASVPTKVQSNDLWDPIWQRMAALMQAAVKLSPGNARYTRLLADAMLQAHDDQGFIDALRATARVDPNDQFTQVRLVDLYTSRMETADAKVTYLKQVLGQAGLATAVKSQAGVECAKLLLERGQPDSARSVLSEALRLNPMNIEGLELRYKMLPPNVSSFERSEALMALLRANPAQQQAAAELANQLATAGLAEESLPWYQLAVTLAVSQGQPDLQSLRSLVAELFLADRAPEAEAAVVQLAKVDPTNPDNWFLRLAVSHRSATKDDYQRTLQQAMNVMSNRVVEAINKVAPQGVAGTNKPTTRPIESEGAYVLPDLALVVAQLNQGGTKQSKDLFVQAVSDLATLEVIFAQQADAATKLLDALAAILPSTSAQLIRLQGWSDIDSEKYDDAVAKLQPISDTDPLAQLGMLKIISKDPANRQAAATKGRKLLGANPSGLMGAILWDGLRDLNVKLVTSSQADALRAASSQFPQAFLRILDQPQSFYALHAEPVNVARSYGEPLIAQVTIQNLTDNDLTIGPDGILQRWLVLSAQVRGVNEQAFPATALDQLSGPIVLPARQSMTQIIRLDQGPLAQYLNADPTVAAQVYATVFTNPTAGPNGSMQSGLGGYGVKFAKVFSRTAAPVSGEEIQQELNGFSTESPKKKIHTIFLLSRFVQLIAAAKDADAGARQGGAFCLEAIRRAQADHIDSVSAFAAYNTYILSTGRQRQDTLFDLVNSDDWRHRQVALLAVGASPDWAVQEDVAKRLADDPEPSVRAQARALLAYAKIAEKLPATQPATQTSLGN